MKPSATLVFFSLVVLNSTLLYAESPFSGMVFGSSADAIKATAKDVSNKQSWEETAYEIVNPTYVLLGQFKPNKCTLTYYNRRLYRAHCEFARSAFEAIYTNFVARRKAPKDPELTKRDKSASWYGEYKEGRFTEVLNVYQLSDSTAVVYTDETQQDFRFQDLFRGATPWIILVIVGGFFGYLGFAWLLSSKCPKCKRRKLKITGKSYENPKDYNPDILGTPDIHWDEIYHYKCANCGYEKDDRYSGFMNWWRSQD